MWGNCHLNKTKDISSAWEPLRSIEACEAVSLEDASPQWTEAVKGMETCQTPTAWPMRYSTWMGFWGSEDVGYCVFIFFACMHKVVIYKYNNINNHKLMSNSLTHKKIISGNLLTHWNGLNLSRLSCNISTARALSFAPSPIQWSKACFEIQQYIWKLLPIQSLDKNGRYCR